MDIQKRCQWCGKPFIAHKMTTLYCSTACIDKAYRAKKKQKLKEQVEDEQQVALPIVESIGDKPYLTPMEAAKLLGVGKTTIYRYMASSDIRKSQVSRTVSIAFISKRPSTNSSAPRTRMTHKSDLFRLIPRRKSIIFK